MSLIACISIFLVFQVDQPSHMQKGVPGKAIPFLSSGDFCQFTFEEKTFTLNMDYIEPTQVSISSSEGEIFSGTLCSPTRGGVHHRHRLFGCGWKWNQ